MKSYKQLVREEIERQGMDGLWCPSVPCGCLKGDLAPCETEDFEGCHAGKRVDFKPDEKCGCEGEGTEHWHVCHKTYLKPTKDKENK